MSFRVEYVGQSPDNIGEKELWVFNFFIDTERLVSCHHRFIGYDYGIKSQYHVGKWRLKQIELKECNTCTNNEKDSELNICERCENLYCEDCSSTYNQFSQIDYNCCSACAETRIEY